MLEAVRIVAGFDDVAVMGQTVEQRRRHLGVAEDVAPFREAQIGGDQQAGGFVQLADQVKQQGPPL